MASSTATYLHCCLRHLLSQQSELLLHSSNFALHCGADVGAGVGEGSVGGGVVGGTVGADVVGGNVGAGVVGALGSAVQV
eukprot:1189632-Prorocentrum_minimum.AAC.2